MATITKEKQRLVMIQRVMERSMLGILLWAHLKWGSLGTEQSKTCDYKVSNGEVLLGQTHHKVCWQQVDPSSCHVVSKRLKIITCIAAPWHFFGWKIKIQVLTDARLNTSFILLQFKTMWNMNINYVNINYVNINY